MSPPTPLTYEILLSLAGEPRHGYGIIKEIEERSGPGATPSTGALYLALQRMQAEGMIAESSERPRLDEDSRRRYYRITERGRSEARAESERLAGLVATARARDLLPGSST